jgi:hypothetical protein
MTSLIWSSFRDAPQAGIRGDLPTDAPPFLITFNNSSSDSFDMVSLSVWSRGFGLSAAAAGPSPFPDCPWHEAQNCPYNFFPCSTSAAWAKSAVPKTRAQRAMRKIGTPCVRFTAVHLLLLQKVSWHPFRPCHTIPMGGGIGIEDVSWGGSKTPDTVRNKPCLTACLANYNRLAAQLSRLPGSRSSTAEGEGM